MRFMNFAFLIPITSQGCLLGHVASHLRLAFWSSLTLPLAHHAWAELVTTGNTSQPLCAHCTSLTARRALWLLLRIGTAPARGFAACKEFSDLTDTLGDRTVVGVGMPHSSPGWVPADPGVYCSPRPPPPPKGAQHLFPE